MICPSCRARTPEDSEFCKNCGSFTYAEAGDTHDGWLPLTEADWKTIADEFREWHKSISLTTIGHFVTFNEAWDNYFAGYRDGYSAGIQRALASMKRP